MPIHPVGSSLAAFTQRIASAGSAVAGNSAAAVEEATESRATTVREAQQGDQVAKRKLQRLQAASASPTRVAQAKPVEPGKGESVDRSA